MDIQVRAVDPFTPAAGEMAARMRSSDWGASCLGPYEKWPATLRTAVNIALGSHAPVLVWWGDDLTLLYNDGYRRLMGKKHPRALGAPGREVWPEIWHIIGPLLESVMQTGVATWSDDQLLLLDGDGEAEERYFTFSYSPITDRDGRVGGVLTLATETTDKVISERRLATLHRLAARAPDAAPSAAAAALAGNPHDLPFALIYLVDSDRLAARLVGAAGIAPGAAGAPIIVPLATDSQAKDPWRLSEVLRTREPVSVRDLRARFDAMPAGPGRMPPDSALSLPLSLPGDATPIGALVCALNPHRRADARYRDFVELLATHIAGIVAGGIDRASGIRSVDVARIEIEHQFRMLADAAPIMIWLSGPDKQCTYLNRRWLEFTGRAREHELGKGWMANVHPDDVPQCSAAYDRTFDARARFTMEYRLRRHDGEYRWVLDHGVPRYHADGRFAGYVGSCIEIHERVQIERIQAIHHDTMHAIASTRDVDATYRAALATVCRHLHWPVGEVWELTPDGDRLHLVAAWHEEVRELADFVNESLDQRLAMGEGFPGRVWAEGRSIQELDLAATEATDVRHLALQAGLRAAYGFPIISDGAITGAMTFMASAVRALDHALEAALSVLAAQVGAVVMQRAAEQRLRESDERFRLLVEGVRDYAIFMLDPSGRVISWNSGAEQINGYRAEEILGRHVSCFYTPRDIAARKPERELEIARTQGRMRDEGWRMRKDGTGFWASFVITATRDAAGNLRGFSKVTRDMTERRRAEDDLRQYADRLRALSNRLVEAQENERRRIAAELHDCIGQSFTALNINLNILKSQLPSEATAVSSRIDDCLALVESTVESIREVIADLRPAVLDDYGLPAALRWFAERFESRTGIVTRVMAEASISRLPPVSEAALFRIAQEALTNVLKHARARNVNIHLLSNPRAVSLSVVDDGGGFEQRPGPAGEHSGWGFMIMRERAEALGGWFSFESAVGQGTRIEVTIPR